MKWNLDPRSGPAYSGFWLPGTSGDSAYLTNHCMVKVASGQYYWLTGFPENTLPTRCDGEAGMFDRVARATVLEPRDGGWWDGDKVYTDAGDTSIFAFARVKGKLHILYKHKTYRILYRRTTMTEIDMYRSWT